MRIDHYSVRMERGQGDNKDVSETHTTLLVHDRSYAVPDPTGNVASGKAEDFNAAAGEAGRCGRTYPIWTPTA